jgi:hypothetical protein
VARLSSRQMRSSVHRDDNFSLASRGPARSLFSHGSFSYYAWLGVSAQAAGVVSTQSCSGLSLGPNAGGFRAWDPQRYGSRRATGRRLHRTRRDGADSHRPEGPGVPGADRDRHVQHRPELPAGVPAGHAAHPHVGGRRDRARRRPLPSTALRPGHTRASGHARLRSLRRCEQRFGAVRDGGVREFDRATDRAVRAHGLSWSGRTRHSTPTWPSP